MPEPDNQNRPLGLVAVVHVLANCREELETAIAEYLKADALAPQRCVYEGAKDPEGTYTVLLVWRGSTYEEIRSSTIHWRHIAGGIHRAMRTRLVGLSTLYTAAFNVTSPPLLSFLANEFELNCLAETQFDSVRIRLYREPQDDESLGERVYFLDGGSTDEIANKLLFGKWAELISLDQVGHKVCWLRRQIRQSEMKHLSVSKFVEQLDSLASAVTLAHTPNLLIKATETLGIGLLSAAQANAVLGQTINEMELQNATLDRLVRRDKLVEIVSLFRNEAGLLIEELIPKKSILALHIASANAVADLARIRAEQFTGAVAERIILTLTILATAVAFAEIFNVEVAKVFAERLSVDPENAITTGLIRLLSVAVCACICWLVVSLYRLIPEKSSESNGSSVIQPVAVSNVSSRYESGKTE